MPLRGWRLFCELIKSNVTGAFRCIKRFLPLTHLSGRDVVSSGAIVQHVSGNDRDDCDLNGAD